MITIDKKSFGIRKDGQEVFEYFIDNGNITLVVTDHGASVTKLFVPTREGKKIDVTLGFDTLSEYEKGTSFGAFVGRVANRISNHSFTLDGKTYELEKNNFNACLHGGKNRYNQKYYETEILENGVRFTRLSPDMEQGFPGNLKVSVEYALTEDNAVTITYNAVTDKATPINFTNHSFFNLKGEGDGTIEDHLIYINASSYQETDCEGIPIKVASVENTDKDFRAERTMKNENGYDSSFILDGKNGASVRCIETGIKMDVETNQVAMQFYTAKGNNMIGKGGKYYGAFSGFCLETQGYVDAINNKNYPSSVLREGDVYEHFVSYKFSNF